ncbi:thioredoxin family protein [Pseudocolwellia agarivorans]|uniref:thioredoxin family protein n=1 Tax=Pseudocolwellia agarivorans TaxID=1911682 RepID=UPI000985F6F6|nr:thioredoxin domain-containing protein [Pseudocolwellia agarivorans]
MTTVNVTDSNFQALVSNTEKPLVIDVWAPWCGPCKMVGPALTNIAQVDPERFQLVMANMEEFEKSADELNVKATPTVLIFKQGKEVARRSGALMKSQLEKWINEHL